MAIIFNWMVLCYYSYIIKIVYFRLASLVRLASKGKEALKRPTALQKNKKPKLCYLFQMGSFVITVMLNK